MVSHDELLGPPAFRASDAQLKQTLITPVLDHYLVPQKSLVFCSTFALAWAELSAFLQGPVYLQPPVHLSDQLNAAPCVRQDLDEPSFVARAGKGPSFLASVRSELAEKFGPSASPQLLPPSSPEQALWVYAYLFKNLAFDTPLCLLDDMGLGFGNSVVQCFGIWETDDPAHLWEKRARQILIHDHRSDDNFVFEIVTKSSEDRLIVARIPPERTLKATVDAALERSNTQRSWLSKLRVSPQLRPREKLAVPLMNFDIERQYREFQGHRIAGTEDFIDEARQSIRLRLDEKGALLRSEAMVGGRKGGLTIQLPPRRFVCDGPFLLLMIRQGRSVPYLAVWIDSPELLVKSQGPVFTGLQ